MRTLLSILLLTGMGLAQDWKNVHPTKDQCRADVSAWANEGVDFSPLGVMELQRRFAEMAVCGQQVDREQGHRYYALAILYKDETAGRMYRFLSRHGEWVKFLAEDGERQNRQEQQ
jgi:hypothetical protein